MIRTYEIHDQYGLVYTGSEHFVSMMWTYLTQPPETVKRLLSMGNVHDVKKALINRKVSSGLKLLRVMATHKPETNEQKS